MAKIPDIAEPGTLVVGASDPSKQQYNDNGRALSQPIVHDGGRLAAVYKKHAEAHGTKIATTAPQAVIGSKAKLKPNAKKKESITTPDVQETPAPVVSVPMQTEERNKYTAVFKIPTGVLRIDILDMLYSHEQNSVAFIYKDADAVTYTPASGELFEVAVIDKLTKSTTNLTAFSPNFIFNMPNTEKVMMVLALDNTQESS